MNSMSFTLRKLLPIRERFPEGVISVRDSELKRLYYSISTTMKFFYYQKHEAVQQGLSTVQGFQFQWNSLKGGSW